MPDEEMDDIIRDAANQHYPAYDDKAWDKMEKLLDKHLPQKEDKRKYLLFLLLFLLVDAGLFVIFFHPKKNSISQVEKNIQSKNQNISNESNSTASNQHDQVTIIDSKKQNIQQPLSPATEIKQQLNSQSIVATFNNDLQKTSKISGSRKAKTKSNIFYSDVSQTKERNISEVSNTQPSNEQPNNLNNTANFQKTTQENIKIPEKNNITIVNAQPNAEKKNDSTSNKQKTIASISPQKKKEVSSFGNNFAFTISTGPGFCYVDNLGKTTFSLGAGIRYSFAKKFAISTGFYVTKKIYSANPSDYDPPKSFWTYYPNLQKINANCTVYEIPLSVSYNFGENKKHSWFVSTGLSSYLMRQENYDYYSKDPNGQTSYSSTSINNQNENIFSVLILSGGYQYNINKKFSLTAAPYIELPMNGIGFGNIKLNSGGILFTAVIKPF